MNRLESVSSATLFFGPAIPQPSRPVDEPMNVDPPKKSTIWSGSPRRGHLQSDSDEEADFFFSSSGPKDSSFTFSLTGDTPSPMKKQRTESVELLPKKFRPRDSGVVLDESDDSYGSYDGLPRASTSVSTINSGSDGEALVTPGFAPTAGSGWPTVGVYNLDEEDDGLFLSSERSVDAFIMRTLTAGTKSSKDESAKRPPGTPVKKIKTSHILDRPWQSAVASKIGFPDFDNPRATKGKKPRQSLPAAFPVTTRPARTERRRRDALNFGLSRADSRASIGSMDVDNEGEDEEASPSMRRDARYEGLGLGRPAARSGADVKGWLMRRSSSGAFSSGSDCTTSTTATPTRLSYAGKYPRLQFFAGISDTWFGRLDLEAAYAISRQYDFDFGYRVTYFSGRVATHASASCSPHDFKRFAQEERVCGSYPVCVPLEQTIWVPQDPPFSRVRRRATGSVRA